MTLMTPDTDDTVKMCWNIFVYQNYLVSLTLSKILSLDNKNKKISFCFVLCSFIRIFASYKAITEDMNITRKIHKSLIYGRLRKIPSVFWA